MKALKKLIPTMCMLLVSASLLGTSTYAWFSMNTQVTAEGMKVEAVTNANLYIKEGILTDAAQITGIAATMGSETHSLKPTNLAGASGTVSVQIPETYTTNPDPDNAGVAGTYKVVGTFTKTTDTAALNNRPTDSDGIGYYIAGETMTLVRKAQTSTNKCDIDASVTITLSTDSALNGSLRCGFLVNDTWVPGDDKNTTTGSVSWSFDNLITNLTDNTVQAVTFVVWFEGSDTDCKANNAITLSNNSVAITFTSSDVTA